MSDVVLLLMKFCDGHLVEQWVNDELLGMIPQSWAQSMKIL